MLELACLMLMNVASPLSTEMPVLAYIGPGMGAGAIAVVFGVIGSIFLALFAVIYYPIKRMLRSRKQADNSNPRPTDD